MAAALSDILTNNQLERLSVGIFRIVAKRLKYHQDGTLWVVSDLPGENRPSVLSPC